MDPTVLSFGAEPSPSAVSPDPSAPASPPQESSSGPPPVSGEATPAPVATAPDTAAPPSSPASAGTPTTTPGPAEPDYRALYEQIAPEFQQQKQAFSQIQQLMALAQQQAAEEEASRAVQSRVEEAQRFAANLAPEDALAYMRRVTDAELARERQEKAAIAQSMQAQQQQLIERVTAPLYAQHLAETHNLPPEYAKRLAMIPDGRQMDAYLPLLKAEATKAAQDAKERADLLAQLDQLRRSVQAGQLAQNGAHVPGGVGVSPIAGQGGSVEAGSTAHLMSIPGVAEFLGLR